LIPSAAQPPAAVEPDEVEVRYGDGSIIRAFLVQDSIEVMTRYGKLTVPTKEIRHIEFGVHLPAGVEKQVEAAIKDLGSSNYKKRETALHELVALGAHAYPALTQSQKSTDLEVAQRVELALKKIRAKVPAKHLRVREDDLIVTPTFTIVGRIVTPTFQARADNFGELNIRISQMRLIRWMGSSKETEVTVEAAKHSGDHWLDSGFHVQSNTRLMISAGGQVDLWPQGPGQYVCGPAGYGQANAIGRPAVVGGRPIAGGNVQPGALLARVGDNGPLFVVGERYQGTPGREGKLFLQIGPNPWNNPSSGSFQVRITPNRDLDEGGD
jgi:hypothetical protein